MTRGIYLGKYLKIPVSLVNLPKDTMRMHTRRVSHYIKIFDVKYEVIKCEFSNLLL